MIRRYLLDTGIAQDFQDGRNGVRNVAIEKRRAGHRVGICPPVLGEFWAGFEYSKSPERSRNRLRLEEAMSWFVHWPYSNEAAAEFGRIFAELKRAGRIIQQIDMQIAAIARTMPHCIVVSKDGDISAVSGVTVENWAV